MLMTNGYKLYKSAFKTLIDMYKHGELNLQECYNEICLWFLQGSIDRRTTASMLRELLDWAAEVNINEMHRYEGRITRKIQILED